MYVCMCMYICTYVCMYVVLMGNLAGHLIPGFFFLIYGSWWCFSSIWLHLKSKHISSNSHDTTVTAHQKTAVDNQTKRNLHLSSPSPSNVFELKRDYNLSRKSWIPLPLFPDIPLEPVLKIVFGSMGLFVEAFLDYKWENHQRHLVLFIYHIRNNTGELNNLEKLHHITLYSGFLLSGIVDLLSLCVRFPWQTSMLFLSLSFFIEAILFYFHIMNQVVFNRIVHSLLVYIVVSCVVFSLLRIYSASNLFINLGLGSSILFQGTWFIQIGNFLFGGFLHKDESYTPAHFMFVVAIFTWHLMSIAVGDLILYVLLSLLSGKKSIFLKRLWKKKRRRLTGLVSWRRWQDTLEEHRKLMVSDDCEGTVDGGMELREVAETCT